MKKHAEWKYQGITSKIQTLGKSTGQTTQALQSPGALELLATEF